MTRISEIHGLGAVPVNEYADRGREVTPADYIPYLSLTEGEMRLELLRQQAQAMAAAFPEYRGYRAAEQMVDAALKAGVHRGVNWIGRIDDQLQDVARQIALAQTETRPAAGHLYGRASVMNGIGEVIPVVSRYQQCLQQAHNIAERIKCQTRFEIEKILNNGLEPSAHHTLYFKIREAYNIPQRAYAKRLFHLSGIEGLANVGEISSALMGGWVDTAVLKRNTSGGVGPIYSDETSFLLSPDPGKAWAEYKAGIPYTPPNPKDDKINARIGEPATLIALAGLITAALAGAVGLLEQMRKNKAYAMSEAKGYGTTAFQALQTDWQNGGGTGLDKNTLLLLAAGAGALLLLSEDN